MILLYITLYLVIGILVFNSKDYRNLFLTIFLLLLSIMSISQLGINNPLKDYIGDPDQPWFYRSALECSRYNIPRMFDVIFDDHSYSELPLAIFINSLLIKFMNYLGIDSFIYGLKIFIVFLSSITCCLTYRIAKIFNLPSKESYKSIIVFSVFSPILFESIQILRDVHIMFLYTFMFWLSIEKKSFLTWPLLLLSIIVTYFLRVESGLFAINFLLFAIYNTGIIRIKGSKIVYIFIVFALLFSYGSYLIDSMNDTLFRYNDRGVETAESGSLGALMDKFPFPIALFGKFIFSNIQPFPVYYRVGTESLTHIWNFIRIVTPFYWFPIIVIYLYGFIKNFKKLNYNIILTFFLTLFFLFAVSFGQGMPRRLMAVYPIVLVLYMYFAKNDNMNIRRIRKFSISTLLILHLIYLLIK